MSNFWGGSDRRPCFPRILRDDFRGAQDWSPRNKNARGGVKLAFAGYTEIGTTSY